MITKKLLAITSIAFGGLLVSSCGSDDGPIIPPVELSNFTLTLNNVEPLKNAVYEGWIIVDGKPISTGTFDGSVDGASKDYTFTTVKANLDKATKFVISIEPQPDTDPAPSDTKFMSGALSGILADITMNDEVGDFESGTSGNFEIFTPSDADDTNEENGVWFLKTLTDGTQEASLELPVLPAGWKYEGWVVFNGIPVSTGTFTAFDADDKTSLYSSDRTTPNFPGQDFLQSMVTSGTTTVTFPADGNVTGKDVIISLEPFPDNDPAPFFVKPLLGRAGTATSPAPNALETFVNRSNAPFGTFRR